MPSSYQAPKRGDSVKKTTVSQSATSNIATGNATVEKLLAGKGDAVFALRPQDTIATAVGLLAEKRIGALLVTDSTGAMQGIMSERDIVRKLAETPGQTLPQKVEDIMTRDVVTCAPSDPLVSVLKRMVDGKFRHMPVVEDGKLRGILTIGDVVHFRLTELEHEALQMKQMIVG